MASLADAFSKSVDFGWVADASGIAVPAVQSKVAPAATVTTARAAAATGSDVAPVSGAGRKRRRADDAATREEPSAAATDAAAVAEGDRKAAVRTDAKGRPVLSRRKRAALADAPKDSSERLRRTVFVGNLPLSTTHRQLSRWLQGIIRVDAPGPAGEGDADGPYQTKDIESIRFRSVPLKSVPIASSDYRVMRKAAFIQGAFDDSKDSMNVCRTDEAAASALAANGQVFNGKHVRVDGTLPPAADATAAAGTQHDFKRSVFLGNLPYSVTVEAVRDLFAPRVTGGHDSILNVRIIRDRATNVGKGFGYVLFKERVNIAEALGMHGQRFEGRPLRVTRCTADGKEPDADKRRGSAASSSSRPAPKHMGVRAEGKDKGGAKKVKKPRHVPRTGAKSAGAASSAAATTTAAAPSAKAAAPPKPPAAKQRKAAAAPAAAASQVAPAGGKGAGAENVKKAAKAPKPPGVKAKVVKEKVVKTTAAPAAVAAPAPSTTAAQPKKKKTSKKAAE